MANIGDSFRVGTNVPETGRYKHSACGDTVIIDKANKFAPCAKLGCPRGGANWILMQQFT
jgi:hypothetical protein